MKGRLRLRWLLAGLVSMARDGVLTRFKLVEATPYPSGVVGLHYTRQV